MILRKCHLHTLTMESWQSKNRSQPVVDVMSSSWCCTIVLLVSCDTMATEARKAVIKNADMIDTLQQDAIDTAIAVPCLHFGLCSQCV